MNPLYFKGVRPIPVIPTVYTDALSYGEQLGIIGHKADECIGKVNEIIEDNETFKEEVTEQEEEYKTDMQSQYDEFLEEYQRQFGVVQTLGNSVTNVISQKKVTEELNAVVYKPNNSFGLEGQVLESTGTGIKWSDIGAPTTEQVEIAVNNWLDAHPEATTTVQDHSLTYVKMVNGTMGFVTPEMFGGVGDGEVDDTQAVIDAGEYAAEHGLALFMYGNYNTDATCILQGIKSIICTGYIKNLWIRNTNGAYLINEGDTLKITSVKVSSFNIGHIVNVSLISDETLNTAPNAGIAYNTFVGGFINNLLITGSTANEWVNENHFYGIRMINVTIEGAYPQNNNIFEDITMEGGTITLENARSNHFRIRGESGYTLNADENSYNNTIEGTYAIGNRLLFFNNTHSILNGNIQTDTWFEKLEKRNVFTLNNTNVWNNDNDYANGIVKFVAWRKLFVKRFKPSCDTIFRYLSDVACFRPLIRLLKNGEPVLTQYDKFVGVSITFNSTTGEYTLGSNVSAYTFGVVKSDVFDEIEVAGYTTVTTNAHEFKCDLYTLGDCTEYIVANAFLQNNAKPVNTSAPNGTYVADSTGATNGWIKGASDWIAISGT